MFNGIFGQVTSCTKLLNEIHFIFLTYLKYYYNVLQYCLGLLLLLQILIQTIDWYNNSPRMFFGALKMCFITFLKTVKINPLQNFNVVIKKKISHKTIFKHSKKNYPHNISAFTELCNLLI